VRRDKEGNFILIKGVIHQGEITITKLYTPYIGAPNIIKHTLMDLKSQIDSNTIIVGDLILLYHQQIGYLEKKITKKV
jgi:hypothetical protein